MRRLALAALVAGLSATSWGCSSPTTALPSPSSTVPGSTAAPDTGPTTTTALTTSTAALAAESTSSSSTASSTTTTTIDPMVLAKLENAVVQKFRKKANAFSRSGSFAIGVAIEHSGGIVDSFSLGKDAAGQPLTNASRFRLGSISKTITAMTIMALVDEGRLFLDKPLRTQWQGTLKVTDRRVRDITIRQLLQHTSGMGTLRDVFFNNVVSDWHEAVTLSLASKLMNPPGSGYRYSNANYAILGALIEQVTGNTVEQAAQRLVLTPLGIFSASFSGTKVTDLEGPAYHVSTRRTYMESLGPAGAWAMAPSDVAKLFGALQPRYDASPIMASTRTQMRKPWAPAGQRANTRYGLGLERYGALWGHTGTLQGVRAIAFMLPNGYTVTVLTAGEVVAKGEGLLTVFSDEIAAARTLPVH